MGGVDQGPWQSHMPVKSQSIPTYRQATGPYISPTKRWWRKHADGPNQRKQAKAKLPLFTAKSSLLKSLGSATDTPPPTTEHSKFPS